MPPRATTRGLPKNLQNRAYAKDALRQYQEIPDQVREERFTYKISFTEDPEKDVYRKFT